MNAFRIAPPDTLARTKAPRVKNPDHLAFIRQLGCVICDRPSEAAHVRFADARYGTYTGKAEKPDDAFTVPLCRECHTQQHSMREAGFWEGLGIDPHALALSLNRVSGDMVRGELIVAAWRTWITDETPIR